MRKTKAKAMPKKFTDEKPIVSEVRKIVGKNNYLYKVGDSITIRNNDTYIIGILTEFLTVKNDQGEFIINDNTEVI